MAYIPVLLAVSSCVFDGCVLTEALQEYVLICCQHPSGGLIDKPGKSVASSFSYVHRVICLLISEECSAN